MQAPSLHLWSVLALAAALSSCRSCHDIAFCEDMMGHSTQEVVAWLGTPTAMNCRYGVDEYIWCGKAAARRESLAGSPGIREQFRDEEGLQHVHFTCAPGGDAHDEDDPRLVFRFYNNQACGYYFYRADKLCNRFVPEHFEEAYKKRREAEAAR